MFTTAAVSGLLGVLMPERWRGRAGNLKEESESYSAREVGVYRRTMKETFPLAMAEEEVVVWNIEWRLFSGSAQSGRRRAGAASAGRV